MRSSYTSQLPIVARAEVAFQSIDVARCALAVSAYLQLQVSAGTSILATRSRSIHEFFNHKVQPD